jgi:hypothetical protein
MWMETASSIMLRGLTTSSCQPADFVSKSLRAGLSCSAPEALHDVPVRTAGGSAGLDTAREIPQKFLQNFTALPQGLHYIRRPDPFAK